MSMTEIVVCLIEMTGADLTSRIPGLGIRMDTRIGEEGAILDDLVPEAAPLQNEARDLHLATQQSESATLSPPAIPIQNTEVQDVALPLDTRVDQTTAREDILKDTLPEQHHIRPRSPTPPPPTHAKLPSTPVSSMPSPPREPLADRQVPAFEPKLEKLLSPPQSQIQLPSSPTQPQKSSVSPMAPQTRSPSPPKDPRNRGLSGQQTSYPRRPSHSPPRGPRNTSGTHPRGVTPTGPASSLASGPRGPRRSFAPTNQLPVPLPRSATPQNQTPIPLPPIEDVQIGTAPAPEAAKMPPPIIATRAYPQSLTQAIDNEAEHLQSHRARLASEYTNLAKETRRALHELDMATIDLRAAELRRKVADNQYEQARSGALGIDFPMAS
ncbi:hypothetical protein C0991_009759 [Blastosporella zonata]|nr:hypothetical protein C0991_009759 [Blastosporella zonata]